MLQFNESDINWKLARDAHYATSFTPDVRADGHVKDYMDEMQAMCGEFGKFATDDNRNQLSRDLEKYRQGYIKRLEAYLHAHSRVMSPMITGPARFPTRSNNKKSDTADRRRNEFLDWRNKFKDRLRKTYDPARIARAPISSDDADAIEKLQAKIDQAQKYQDIMKACNAIVRKKKLTDEQKVKAMVEAGVTEKTAWGVLQPNYMVGKAGFPSYQLQNNNANIRRMKQRIEVLKRDQEREQVEDQVINGVTVSENTDLNRIQLFFDGKPPYEMRQKLKSRGFRWSPRNGAWQRHLNDAGRHAVKQVLN